VQVFRVPAIQNDEIIRVFATSSYEAL
jgi:hypothetical protein